MNYHDDRIKKELVMKEEQLLENKIRNNADKLAELIDDNCIDFSAAGKQHKYKSGDLFGEISGVSYIDSNSIELVDIADNCKLLLYIAAKVNNNTRIKSNCSSIWKRKEEQWKIIFHQETISTAK